LAAACAGGGAGCAEAWPAGFPPFPAAAGAADAVAAGVDFADFACRMVDEVVGKGRWRENDRASTDSQHSKNSVKKQTVHSNDLSCHDRALPAQEYMSPHTIVHNIVKHRV